MHTTNTPTSKNTDNPENPLHEHARQLHESAAAHAALLASIKAVHAGQAVNASTGPAAL